MNSWNSENRPQDAVGILDQYGFVRLDDFMASDLSVINSARVSFGKRKDVFNPEEDRPLINYLMKNRHGTPFEHNAFRFHVKAPIFVVREWQRHRIGSFNEMSARYMELPAQWYIPDEYSVRIRVGRPGHYTFEPGDPVISGTFRRRLNEACDNSYHEYKEALSEGIAPELARCFLHVNHYTEMYWTVNCRALMNFLNLRNAPTAQWEIQQFARIVEAFAASCMPETIAAFVTNGRVAP